MGGAYDALIWKLMLDPTNGALGFLARTGWPVWDWTASRGSALAAVGLIQLWTWALVTAAAFASISGAAVTRARSLFELDGSKALRACFDALWAARRGWVLLITLGLVVENLRTFEVVYVLSRGGPGTATQTLQWSIFEKSYLIVDSRAAAALALVLVIVCAVAMALAGRLGRVCKFAGRRK